MVALDFSIMICVCPNNSKADKSEVAQTGFVDLVQAFKNKCVPSSIEDKEAQYGNIEDATHIYARATDVFDQMQKSRAFSAALKAQKDAKSGKSDSE